MSKEDKPLEDMTPDEMEGLLIDGIASGDMEFAGMEKNDVSVSITNQGEGRVMEMLGGADVLEVSNKLFSLLVKHGALGFDVEANFKNFTIIAQLMSILKHYENWNALRDATMKD